jgi:undecaprenyl-diphosphatase
VSDVLHAAILGVVQGLTEFLPISSTGHLVITERALGLSRDKFGLRFDAALHLGTPAAVLIYFRTTIAHMIGAWIESVRARRWDVTKDSRLAWLIILGTVPAAIAGYFIESTAEDAFRSPTLVAVMLILFSIPMVLAERFGGKTRDLDSATPRDALLMGVAQSIALVPGVSRSGITISAGMLVDFRRDEAAVFAFLLSGPIIAGAGGKQLADILRGSAESATAGFWVYAAGLIMAAVVGFAAIAFLVRYLRFNPLTIFIVYRIVAGLVILGLVAAGAL